MTIHCTPPLHCLECLSAQTFDAVSTAVAHVSFDGHILRANERFSEVLGYQRGELAGMPISEICAGYDAAAEQEFLRRLPNDRLAIHSITRALRRKDREIVYLPIEVSQVRTHEQAASCVLWVVDEPRDVRTDLGIEQIALNVSVETGESFFRSLLLNVTSALNVDMAFIGEIAPDSRTGVQTIVACDRGEFIPNFRYELANSPCELVIGRQICAFPSGVTKLFPLDEGLIHWQIESYIGAPLFDSTHGASGILVILDRKPLVEQAKADALIRIFAPRVAAELERRHTEIELRRNERSLVEAQRLGRIGSWEWDVVHGTLRLSEVARELYGRDFASPDPLIDLIHEDDREAMRADADRLATEGVRLDMLFRFPGEGGQFRVFHGRGAAVRDESGRVVATRGTVQDVTERELADATVRMLSQAVEQSGEQVVITDTHSRVEYVNAAFEAQTGFSLEDVLGTSLLKLRAANPAEDASFQAMLDVTREGRPVGGVFECRRKSGETYFAELRVNSVRDVDGRLTRYVTSAIDITDRRLAEIEQESLHAAIRRSATEWRDTFDAIASPILVCSPDGTILRMNRAALDVSGFEGFDLIGGPITGLGADGLWQRADDLVRFARSTGTAMSSEVKDEASGKTWDVTVNIAAGDVGMMIIIARDITLMVELQESLRATEKMSAMGALVAGVAHEVRNPLFGLSATLDAFEARIEGREEFSRYTSVLRGQIDRLNLLMTDLLDYGKPAVLQLRKAAFGGVVRRAITTCEPFARNARVTLRNHVPETFAELLMDPDRVLQAISNVIQNAIQHAPSGTSVEIEPLERDGATPIAGCAVLDAGAGFNPDDMAHVFQPFFTRRRGGTGLGLSIVQRIVEQHGGQISISNREGGGGRVEIVFPRISEEAGA